MIGLTFSQPIKQVLCMGAHADDIEIGSAGLIGMLAEYPETEFRFVVFTGDDRRRSEAELSMKALVGDAGSLHMAEFDDGFLPYAKPDEAKRFAREAIDGFSPQLVLTPHEADRHQDHSFVAHLGKQLLRDHLVLEYEIAKYDADLGRPQVFVALDGEVAEWKLTHLAEHFESQRGNPWYDDESFRSLLRIRGNECNSPSGYAEAFHVSKLRLGVSEGSSL